MKDDFVYINHILDASTKIRGYLDGLDFESFKTQEMVFDVVVRELEIIGEAANKISDKFQMEHADIPWARIVGLRNKIVHEYFGVDRKIVWATAMVKVPELAKMLSSVQ